MTGRHQRQQTRRDGDLEERLGAHLAQSVPPPSAALLKRLAAIPAENPRLIARSARGRWLDGWLKPIRLAWAAGVASVLVAAVAGFLIGSSVEASYDTASDLSGLVYGPGEAPEDWP